MGTDKASLCRIQHVLCMTMRVALEFYCFLFFVFIWSTNGPSAYMFALSFARISFRRFETLDLPLSSVSLSTERVKYPACFLIWLTGDNKSLQSFPKRIRVISDENQSIFEPIAFKSHSLFPFVSHSKLLYICLWKLLPFPIVCYYFFFKYFFTSSLETKLSGADCFCFQSFPDTFTR